MNEKIKAVELLTAALKQVDAAMDEPDPERHFQSVLFDQTGHEYSLERYRQQYFLHVEADAADR